MFYGELGEVGFWIQTAMQRRLRVCRQAPKTHKSFRFLGVSFVSGMRAVGNRSPEIRNFPSLLCNFTLRKTPFCEVTISGMDYWLMENCQRPCKLYRQIEFFHRESNLFLVDQSVIPSLIGIPILLLGRSALEGMILQGLRLLGLDRWRDSFLLYQIQASTNCR